MVIHQSGSTSVRRLAATASGWGLCGKVPEPAWRADPVRVISWMRTGRAGASTGPGTRLNPRIRLQFRLAPLRTHRRKLLEGSLVCTLQHNPEAFHAVRRPLAHIFGDAVIDRLMGDSGIPAYDPCSSAWSVAPMAPVRGRSPARLLRDLGPYRVGLAVLRADNRRLAHGPLPVPTGSFRLALGMFPIARRNTLRRVPPTPRTPFGARPVQSAAGARGTVRCADECSNPGTASCSKPI